MYAFRIARKDWWDFTKDVRSFYRLNHPLLDLIFEGYDNSQERELLALMSRLPDDLLCRIQLFEEGADSYVFRVLENFDFFINTYKGQTWPIEAVFYDPKHPELGHRDEHIRTAEWMDALIEEGRYLIYPVLSREDFIQEAIRAIRKARGLAA